MSARVIGQRLTFAALASSLVCIMAVGATAADALNDESSEGDQPVPDVVMREFEPRDFTAQAAELPSDLVEAIERDLDMSAERYLADAAAAKTADDVIASLGDVVKSAWLDGQRLHVSVGNRSEQAAVAATGAKVHVGDALFDAVRAARSQGRVAFADRQNDKVIPIEADFVGGPARSGDAPPEANSSTQTLSGGFGYVIEESDTYYRCTAAFSGTSSAGQPLSLTAGHCLVSDSEPLDGPINLLDLSLQDGTTDETGHETEGDTHADDGNGSLLDDLTNGLLGTEDPEDEENEPGELLVGGLTVGGGDSAALVEINGEARLRPEVAAGGGDPEQSAGLSIYDSMAPISGAPACKSGITSGWTCGNVVAAESTVKVGGDDVTGFMFDACTVSGDSGGAVVVGHYALGVSAGSTLTGTDCGDAGQSPQVAIGYRLSGGDTNVASLYGDDWNLSVHVGAPAVTAPVEGDVTGKKPTFRGNIDAAAGSTVVVTVGGHEPVEAVVRADGSWRVPIEDALPPGRHNYTVRAQHTPSPSTRETESETVEGTFEVAEVASLVVHTPAEGDTTNATEPRFFGTGDPGARITLEFDDSTTSAVVDDDGTWTVSPSGAERAGRFEATVTQETRSGEDEVVLENIGIVPGAPLVAAPEGGVEADYAIAGSALPDSTVAVRILREESADTIEDEPNVGEHVTVADGEGRWEVELNDLAPGQYSVNAVQAVDDLTSERSATVQLHVTSPPDGHARTGELDDDLAETGSRVFVPVMVGIVLLGLGTVGIVAFRLRGLRWR
ncbi:Ig-like domain-containing protein [Phytoactinopolyspora mesophila]|uniref:Trypsin-like serine protease n=1 Tax=Phytoactinopolyspora mesophila TaxID=2650750 RepID=A0A7K3M9P3_9ACTN|nr:Ig-like domain-containing protein [Phytoactinopolyspora mesophila]NDL59986.1 hypothetical protein [Phytoactinopolyspora mesophila]